MPTAAGSGNVNEQTRIEEPEAVATECLIYGYASKATEWKVISKYERLISPSIICEDYPREDPDLFLSSNAAYSHSRSAIVVHKNLSKDALRKSRVYRGGDHWIKVTFDCYQAAERACFYSPMEIDGHLVFCEMWQGRGPFSDAPLLKGSHSANELERNATSKMRTLTTSQSTQFLSGAESAVAGFERATQTLPRSFTPQDIQYGQSISQDDASISSTTASSATATEHQPRTPGPGPGSALRSRSVPSLPSQLKTPPTNSLYMTHIPSVKRAVLRPISEALPPRRPLVERVLRSVPYSSGLFDAFFDGKQTANPEMIEEGPALKEDGSWDENNGWYWSFWHAIDSSIGTDFCGLKDD